MKSMPRPKKGGMVHAMKVKGEFKLEFIRDGKKYAEKEFPNAAVLEGRNHLLNVGFHGTTQVTAWKLGLIDNASWSALDDSDTLASHAGWLEFEDYDESSRPTWTENAASASSMTTSGTVDFTISSGGPFTLRGAFLASDATKGGTTGTLWATGEFAGAPVTVASGDVVRMTYTITLFT